MSRKKRKENCNRYRKNQQQGESHLRLVQGGAPLERTRKQSVNITPRNFHQDDLLGYLENHNINIVFAVGPAGCSLPGSTVEIQSVPQFINAASIKQRLEVTSKHLETMRKYNWVSFQQINYQTFEYDINSVNYALLKIAKNKSKAAIAAWKNDSAYNSKYLKIEHWLGFNDIEYSIQKVKVLRKYKQYFEDRDPNNYPHYNPETLQKTIMNIQSIMINNDFKNKSDLPYFKHHDKTIMKEFWVSRGWDEEDAIVKAKDAQSGRQRTTVDFWKKKGYSEERAREKISQIQKQNCEKLQKKYSKEQLRQIRGYSSTVEYFLDRGFSEEDALEQLREKQTTFSLDICIEKYGYEEGVKRWKERQNQWQNTLDSKSPEEKQRINQNKSKSFYKPIIFDSNDDLSQKSGMLYYIRFFNDETEFWKIGITTRPITARFGSNTYTKAKFGLDYEIIFVEEMTIYEAWLKEQSILKENTTKRIKVNINGFSTTEAFEENIYEN